MKLTSYKNRRLDETFAYCINLFFILLSLGALADERQRQIEYEAINLVIKKYGKGLENRLKGTGLSPNYRSWYENDCFVSIAAGKYQEYTWSTMEWFSVNVCSNSAEIMEYE